MELYNRAMREGEDYYEIVGGIKSLIGSGTLLMAA